jgi:hypothetical protein
MQQNSILKEVKRELDPGNDYCYSFQYLLPSCLLSGKSKIKINKTIVLPVPLYGCETLSRTLMEERRLFVVCNNSNNKMHTRRLY